MNHEMSNDKAMGTLSQRSPIRVQSTLTFINVLFSALIFRLVIRLLMLRSYHSHAVIESY